MENNADPAPRSGKVVRGIIWSIIVVIVLAAYGLAFAIYSDTIVEWYIPWGISLVLALLSWFLFRGMYIRLCPDTHVLLCLFGHLVAATGLWLMIVLGLNSRCADRSTTHTEQATVVGHFREKHYRSQRVSRRVYRRGTPYYEYVVRLQFPSGKEKDFKLSLEKYNRLRNGMTIEVPVSRGFLGFPVVERPDEL